MRHRLTDTIALSLGIAILTVVPSPVLAQDLSLLDVLARATDYVARFSDQLSGTVAEEHYEQRATTPATNGFGGFRSDRNGIYRYRRTLRSDYLLVRPEGSDRYYGFRDVFEVDGRPVRDRDERLALLFLNPSTSTNRQINGILSDSARYNIGEVERNFNTPTLALLFLRASHKPRFEFERVAGGTPRLGVDVPDTTVSVWVVEYVETWPTTLIRGRDRENLPATGRFWIETATGRVLVSELTLKNAEVDVTITVRYSPDEKMGHLVPAEMRERYENRRQGSFVEGTATYTRFRRFQVQIDESEPFRD